MLPDIEQLTVAYATSKPKIYYTHDNFLRPFRVTIITQVGQYNISVDSGTDLFNGQWDYESEDRKHYNFVADQLFLPGEQIYKTSGSITAGHCCLFKLKNKNRYVMVGTFIYSFVPYDSEKITYFYSELHGSDIAYPIALTKTYAYMLYVNQVVERKYFDPNVVWKNSYDDLWGRNKSKFYDVPGYEWKNEYNEDNFEYNENYRRLRSLTKYAKKLPHLIIINNYRFDVLFGYSR